MTISMTGFAAARGAASGYAWAWEIRSVNGKGLDLRLKVPEWIDGLEAALRGELQKRIGRGNVSLTLRVSREEGAASGPRVNSEMLASVLRAIAEVEGAAKAAGLDLASASAAEIIQMRGVLDSAELSSS